MVMMRLILLSFGLFISCLTVRAQTIWPQFRGPGGQGVSTLAAPPAQFGIDSNLLWSTTLPPGHSSPVIAGDRIFLTAVEKNQLKTLAINRSTGQILWQRPAPAEVIERVHPFASPAAPTPLVDDQRVVVFFGSCGLLCYDHEGKELWSRRLPAYKSTYGAAASPIRAGQTAVLAIDSNDKTSRLIAVNLADGAVAWETPRPLSTSGWSTPTFWEHEGKSEIVVLGARRLVSYDSRTGRELWWMDGFPVETIGVPVIGDGLLYVSSSGLAGPPAERFETMTWAEMVKLDANGDGKIQKAEIPDNFRFTLRPELPADHPGRYQPTPFRSLFNSLDGNRDGELTEPEFMSLVQSWSKRADPALKAIRPGGAGEVTATHVAWQLKKGIPEIPSPLFHKGRLYLIRDGGFVACINAKSGEIIYQQRVGGPGGYCASPVAAGDHIYLASHQGTVTCISALGDELKVLAKSDLNEKIWATPALAEGVIYVRTEKHLFAFARK